MMKFRKSPSILGLRFSQVIHDDILKITFHFGLRFPQATPKQWKKAHYMKNHTQT
jgi:hypothetical protein